jgi:hypothetical protein
MSRPSKATLIAFFVGMLVAAGVIALEAGPAAAAPGKYKIAHFKVEVKGIQKTTQTFHHKPENECDISDTSAITEKVVFKSTPKVMTFYEAPGELNPIVLFDKPGKWPTAATVTRHYTPRIVAPPASPQCGEADGGESVAPVYDCGTKKVPNYEVELKYDERKKGGLHVFGGDHDDPFTNCLAPVGDLSFPFLILDDTNDKPILAELPEDEVFDTGLGKLIVLGRGVQKVEEPDISAKVSIEWDVSLTRVAK